MTSATPDISRQLTDGMPGHDNGDLADAGERPPGYLAAELSLGLAGLSFVGAAIRRRAKFWCGIAVAGLALGGALYAVHSPAWKASTSVLLTQNPDQNPMDAVLTDVALARTRAVAGPVLRRLRIPQDVNQFLGSYTVVAVTDRVLQFTVNAPSSAQATRLAAALAAEFLSLRAHVLVSQQRLTMALLRQKVAAAKQRVAAIDSQIKAVSAQSTSPAGKTELSRLQAQGQQASDGLIQLQQAVLGFEVQSQVSTASMITGSKVLDPAAPLARSWLLTPVAYAAAGLIAGCVLGICLVITQTLVTDKLRRRDDVALALGAPVRLSVGHVRVGRCRVDRWLGWRLLGRRAPAQGQLTSLGNRDLSRVIAYLRAAVPQGPADRALVVVPAGNPRVAVLSVLSLALSCAREGKQVMVADLSEGALVARLLKVAGPGVHVVTLHDVRLMVALPDPVGITRAGPLRQHGQGGVGPADQQLSNAYSDDYASTDLLLTVASLDPALGADYLGTWASSAVIMVTAGESSVTKITAVRDMIRCSGTTLSAVLLGADKGDESFGAQADGTSNDAASVM